MLIVPLPQRLEPLDVVQILRPARSALEREQVFQRDERRLHSGCDFQLRGPGVGRAEREWGFHEQVYFRRRVPVAEQRKHGETLFGSPGAAPSGIGELLERNRGAGLVTESGEDLEGAA